MHNKKFKLEVGKGYLDSNFKVVYFIACENKETFISASKRMFSSDGVEIIPSGDKIDIICPLDKDLFELASNLYGKNNEYLVGLIQFFRFVNLHYRHILSDKKNYNVEAIILNREVFDERDILVALDYIDEKSLKETHFFNSCTPYTMDRDGILFIVKPVPFPLVNSSSYLKSIDGLVKF